VLTRPAWAVNGTIARIARTRPWGSGTIPAIDPPKNPETSSTPAIEPT